MGCRSLFRILSGTEYLACGSLDVLVGFYQSIKVYMGFSIVLWVGECPLALEEALPEHLAMPAEHCRAGAALEAIFLSLFVVGERL